MSKTVIMLIGPKGSGKTHIGGVIEARREIPFLRVEPIWLALEPGQDGWREVEQAIDRTLDASDAVVIESLGGSEGFERLRANLAARHVIRFVRVVAPLDVCLERVRTRDSADHIPISDDKVQYYNELAAQVTLPWDCEIQNHPPASETQILAAIDRLR